VCFLLFPVPIRKKIVWRAFCLFPVFHERTQELIRFRDPAKLVAERYLFSYGCVRMGVGVTFLGPAPIGAFCTFHLQIPEKITGYHNIGTKQDTAGR
jgi:hypothetical protein